MSVGNNESGKKWRFGVFEVDLEREELRRQGLKVKLQGQPLRLLMILLERPGEMVTREVLQTRLWDPDVFVDFDHSLNKAVNKLRDSLGDSADNPRFVETLSRRGYRFIAPVQEISDDRSEAANPVRRMSEEDSNSPSSDFRSAFVRWMAWTNAHKRYVLAMLPVLILAATGVPFFLHGPAASRNYAIVVLPFENVDNRSESDYLIDGLGESVIHSLSRFTELRVTSQNSSSRYKGRSVDASVVGHELGVGVVLVGRVRNAGDKTRITVELIDATDNHTIWGQRFDRNASQLAGVEDEIALQTVKNLRAQVSPRELNFAGDTRNSEAFRLYLEANYDLSKITEGSTLKAIRLFEQALEKDPRYALAWAGIAQAYNLLPYFGTYSPAETLNKARAAALRALEFNPDLAEAHTALASIREDYDWDWEGAELEYKKAISLNPSYGQARHWHAHFLSRMGRHEEAIAEAKRAAEVDPLSPPVIVNLASAYVFARQFDHAIAECRRAIQLDPNFPDAHYVLAIAYRETGLHKEGIEEFRKQIAANNGNKYALGFLGYALAVSGRKQEAEAVVKELKTVPDVSPLAFALVYTGLHKDQLAMQFLEKAFASRDPYIRYLKVDPCFERLRDDNRFRDLLKRAHLDSPTTPVA